MQQLIINLIINTINSIPTVWNGHMESSKPTEISEGGNASYKVNGVSIISNWKVEKHVQF